MIGGGSRMMLEVSLLGLNAWDNGSQLVVASDGCFVLVSWTVCKSRHRQRLGLFK